VPREFRENPVDFSTALAVAPSLPTAAPATPAATPALRPRCAGLRCLAPASRSFLCGAQCAARAAREAGRAVALQQHRPASAGGESARAAERMADREAQGLDRVGEPSARAPRATRVP